MARVDFHCKARYVMRHFLVHHYFGSWPVYWRAHFFGRSPFKNLIRFQQIQFCVVNHISCSDYINFILHLNVNVSGELNEEWRSKIRSHFDYTLSVMQVDPYYVSSYSVEYGCMVNGKKEPIQGYGRNGLVDDLEPVPWGIVERMLTDLKINRDIIKKREASIVLEPYEECDDELDFSL